MNSNHDVSRTASPAPRSVANNSSAGGIARDGVSPLQMMEMNETFFPDNTAGQQALGQQMPEAWHITQQRQAKPPVQLKPASVNNNVVQLMLDRDDARFLYDHMNKFYGDYKFPSMEILEAAFNLIKMKFDEWSDIEPYRGEIIAEAIAVAKAGGKVLTWEGPDEDEDESHPIGVEPHKESLVASPQKEKPKEKLEKKEKEKEEIIADEGVDDWARNIDVDEIIYQSSTYKTIPEMYSAINQKTRKQKYAEIREAALKALVPFRGKNVPKNILSQLSTATKKFLVANDAAIEYADAKGLANKTILEEGQKKLMWESVAEISTLSGIDFDRPTGIIRDMGNPINKTDSQKKLHQLGASNKTITGLEGAKNGTPAFTMTASVALNNIYQLSFKNAFVAGHLVTQKAGGKGDDDNVTPTPGYFNQGAVRTPESKAEKLMREHKVISYYASAKYDRISDDGSDVDFDAADLAMIPTAIYIKINEMRLKEGGDGKNIADWTTVGNTVFDDTVTIDLSLVKSDLVSFF